MKSIFIFLFTAQALFAAPVEVLKEDGVTISFEKTGDDSQVKKFKDDVVPKVKTIINAISQDFGQGAQNNAKIFFYSPETYAKKFPSQVRNNISAFYDGTAVYASADNELSHSLENTLRHELTHLILGQNFCNEIPNWVNEGLAVYEERKNTIDSTPIFVDYNTIVVAKQQGNMMPLKTLEGASIFHREKGTEPSKLAYRISYVAAYELIQKSGMDSMRQYLSAVCKTKKTDDEFSANFGMTYEKFNEYLVEISEKKT